MTPTQMGLLAFAAVMIENILRSTQSKNVTAGYTKAVFFTGGMMTLCDGIIMTIIAKGGLEMLPYTVTASAIGWIVGIKVHDYLTAEHRAKLKAEKKAKKRLRIQRAVAKAILKSADVTKVHPELSHLSEDSLDQNSDGERQTDIVGLRQYLKGNSNDRSF